MLEILSRDHSASAYSSPQYTHKSYLIGLMGILRNIIDVVMTKNQKLYLDYLLRRLGFEDDLYLKNYLNHLEKNLWIHRSNIFYNNDKTLDKNWFDHNEKNETYIPKEINLLSLF